MMDLQYEWWTVAEGEKGRIGWRKGTMKENKEGRSKEAVVVYGGRRLKAALAVYDAQRFGRPMVGRR